VINQQMPGLPKKHASFMCINIFSSPYPDFWLRQKIKCQVTSKLSGSITPLEGYDVIFLLTAIITPLDSITANPGDPISRQKAIIQKFVMIEMISCALGVQSKPRSLHTLDVF